MEDNENLAMGINCMGTYVGLGGLGKRSMDYGNDVFQRIMMKYLILILCLICMGCEPAGEDSIPGRIAMSIGKAKTGEVR